MGRPRKPPRADRQPRRRRHAQRQAEALPQVRGVVTLQPDGSARLTPDDGRGAPVYIAPPQASALRSGDRVVVQLEPGRKGKLRGIPLGKGQRRSEHVVGILRHRARALYVDPEPIGAHVLVEDDATGRAHDGQAVWLRITQEASSKRPAAGVVEEVLGDPKEHRVQVELLVRSLGWPLLFGEDALAQASAFADVQPNAVLAGGRRDLRGVDHVTIDGEDARDFDDAVAARPEGDGMRVWVSIADVSHYVQPGSALDREARERATSVYFPHGVLPMLPERLSNDLCSLRPKLPRLTLTAEFLLHADGKPKDVHVYPSLIESRARLTYKGVQDVLTALERGGGIAVEDATRLRPLLTASRWLRERRRQRGALDLDLPELLVILGPDGEAQYTRLRARWEAHRVVEDLMIAANEAVAELLAARRWPTLYRIHERPEEKTLTRLKRWLELGGKQVSLDQLQDPRAVASLVDGFKRDPRGDVAQTLLLRSLPQARYSARNQGHFGLGSRAYLHFTSPIRRYPDLLVHRSLKVLWSQGDPLQGMETAADHCSQQERRAVDAERSVQQLYSCHVAAQYVGQEMAAQIVGVHTAGFFVRTGDPVLEGLVPMHAVGVGFRLADDELSLVGGSGARWTLGDRVQVRVASVSAALRRIDFELAAPARQPAVARGAERRSRDEHRGRGRSRRVRSE